MENRQNLLVIMVDQLRYDCLGFTGCPAASTPNLDRLAREGAWFDRAYTSLPSCCPARQSFLTGLRPEQLGAHWNFDITLPVASITQWQSAGSESINLRTPLVVLRKVLVV